MSQAVQEQNKALVLEAFDTLFNKREYKAAEQYWSLNYIQHSAHIEPGREGRHRHGDLFPGTEEDDGASNIRRGPRSGGIVVPPSPSAFVSCS